MMTDFYAYVCLNTSKCIGDCYTNLIPGNYHVLINNYEHTQNRVHAYAMESARIALCWHVPGLELRGNPHGNK